MERKGRTLTCILWLIMALWMGLCLYLSWQPGEETVGLSRAIAQFIEQALQRFGVQVDAALLHTFLRRYAHAAIFYVTAVLLSCAVRRSLPRRAFTGAAAFFIAAAACSLLAVVAEAGKLWIPGRHLQWDETLLDVIGAVFGAGVTWAAWSLLWPYKRRR